MSTQTVTAATESTELASASRDVAELAQSVWLPRIIAILATILATFLITRSYSVFNQTTDESMHIATGMEWLSRGTYNYETLHPPVARIAVAILPYLAGVRSTGNPKKWDEANAVLEYAGKYRRNLTLARIGVLPFFWFACYLLWSFGKRFLTEWHGAVTVTLLCLCPPVLAHSGVATTDVPLLAMFLWASIRIWMFLRAPDYQTAAWAGLAVGLAIMTKFTAMPFFLVTFGLLIFYSFFRKIFSIPTVAYVATVIGVVLVTVWAVYRFSVGPTLDYASLDPQQLAGLHRLPHVVQQLLLFKWMPAHEFPRGIVSVYHNNMDGRASYLLGQTYVGGRWAFFPVALLVKTPIPLLILTLGGLIYVWFDKRLRANKNLLLPTAAIAGPLAVAIPSNINLGLRHVLPVYPFLCILAAVAIVELWNSYTKSGQRNFARRFLAVVLLLWSAVTCIRITPDFLAYFNEAAAPYADKILVDSDLDWGQDLFRLISYTQQEKIDHVWLAYQGTIDLSRHIPADWQMLEPQQKQTGWIAISEFTEKMDAGYHWLNNYKPVREIGHSIRLYYVVP
jgi:hypothetical protein